MEVTTKDVIKATDFVPAILSSPEKRSNESPDRENPSDLILNSHKKKIHQLKKGYKALKDETDVAMAV